MKLRVDRTLVLALAMSAAGAAFAAQDASRDVTTEVYAGQELTAPGQTVRNPPLNAVIYDNGPLITHPGGGAGGADASAVQTAAGQTLFGSNQSSAAGFRVADDFTVPAGASWTIDTIEVFAYQTGSTTTSTLTGVTLQIWNGLPNAAGSVVVFGDATTNRMASTTFSNIFRVLDTGLTNTQRPIMRQTVTVGTTLGPGTYWLDWAHTGSLASGPWQPPISIMGQTTTGNAMQRNGTTWGPALDGTFPQGFPFILNGPNVTVAPVVNSVDPAGNNVLQPNEAVIMAPTWRNTGSAAVALTGALTNFTGPTGPTYNLVDAAADYGTIAPASNASCGTNCYSLSISSASRPAVHWDASVVETVNPSATAKTWTLHVGDTFTDVAAANPFYRFIETIVHKGVTGGCTTTTYCPGAATTRDQMAVFVLVAREPAGYSPVACGTTPMFTDVPVTSPFCKWIEELSRRGVVTGCGTGLYCPASPANREQMAVFVLRTLDPALNPPNCTTPMFADVPASSPFCKWFEELSRRGVVTGCGGGNYCPGAPVTREQMSVFLAVTFGLVLYGI